MRAKKWRRVLERDFGTIPDTEYVPGDMESIRTYADFRHENGQEPFWIDDVTWNDLDMDRVFKRINPRLSTAGEQHLYYMLRSPALEPEAYRKRKELIDLMSSEPKLRLDLQMLLARRVGRTRHADLRAAFNPAQHGHGWLVVYLLLMLLVPASAVAMALWGAMGAILLVLAIGVNSTVHELRKRSLEKDLDTVNYSVSMVFALHRVRALKSAALNAQLQSAFASLDRLRAVLRTGGVSAASYHSMSDLFTSVLLIDLIAYEFLKNKLGRCHADVFAVYEALGRVDAAIAVASYRGSLEAYAEPEIDFMSQKAYLHALRVTHPLLPAAVPNDVDTARPMLITGSNASGKSTYLKTAALCALMAQALCTCTAASYKASAFRILSSMALKDDLSSGESYYIVETRSLKRILDQLSGGAPVLCTIDEVLRGTNTVERIAASCEILREIARSGALCIAATHDIELCELLKEDYALFHFEEQVTEREMTFDYLIRPGKATSRNAINLLGLIGLDDALIARAHERANRYMESGRWSQGF